MTGLGKRYAAALLQLVGEPAAPEALGELRELDHAFGESPDLRRTFENPGVPPTSKDALVDALVQRGLSPPVGRFLKLVVQRRRVGQFGQIVEAFQAEVDGIRKVLRARILTARPLSPGTLAACQERLARHFGKPVLLENLVCEDLLAGVRVQVGSTVYDGSAAGALRSLVRSLVKGQA